VWTPAVCAGRPGAVGVDTAGGRTVDSSARRWRTHPRPGAVHSYPQMSTVASPDMRPFVPRPRRRRCWSESPRSAVWTAAFLARRHGPAERAQQKGVRVRRARSGPAGRVLATGPGRWMCRPAPRPGEVSGGGRCRTPGPAEKSARSRPVSARPHRSGRGVRTERRRGRARWSTPGRVRPPDRAPPRADRTGRVAPTRPGSRHRRCRRGGKKRGGGGATRGQAPPRARCLIRAVSSCTWS
jgi:hypothetical protein